MDNLKGASMDTANLTGIAKHVLDAEGQSEVEKLLQDGEIDEAKECLLHAIDIYYDLGLIAFFEAAEFYNLLDLPTERACMFRQKSAEPIQEYRGLSLRRRRRQPTSN